MIDSTERQNHGDGTSTRRYIRPLGRGSERKQNVCIRDDPAIGRSPIQSRFASATSNVYYGSSHAAIKHVSMDIADREVTALMGPSGCGKSTFLRALNRMHDLTPGARVTGERSCWTARNSMPQPRMWFTCASGWAWSFSARIPSRSRSSRMSPTACRSRAGKRERTQDDGRAQPARRSPLG